MSRKVEEQVQHALGWLEEHSNQHERDNLVRFGITATNALGVSMKNMQLLAKELGRSHDLAFALWATLTFKLWIQTPHAWAKVNEWSDRPEEFLKCLFLIERAAADDSNFVKKSVSWALRSIGRRDAVLNSAAVALAHGLAASPAAAPRWIGKDALCDLTKIRIPRPKGRQKT